MLLLEGTALDNTLRPLASWLMQHFPLICLSRISHAGFRPGFSPYRCSGAFSAQPARIQHLLHLYIFALAVCVTRWGYRQVIFTLKMQRSPAWFPRSAPLVQHTQPEAAAEHFPEPKKGEDSREQCSTAALHEDLGARTPHRDLRFASLSTPERGHESRAGLLQGWQMFANPPRAP